MPRLLRLLSVFIFLAAVTFNIAQQCTVIVDEADWSSILDDQDADQGDRWEFVVEKRKTGLQFNVSVLPQICSTANATVPVASPAPVVAISQYNQATTVLQL